jgi:hypothetical protein
MQAVDAIRKYIPIPPPWLFAVSSVSEALYILLAGFAIYALFFGVGTGLSVAFAFESCQKVDTEKSLKYAAIWAVYPTIAWYVVRILAIFRTKFDDVFTYPWISIGYVLTLASLAGIFSLSSNSTQSICVASIDEAQEFRNRLAAQQAAKDANVKAAQESTPAVSAVI